MTSPIQRLRELHEAASKELGKLQQVYRSQAEREFEQKAFDAFPALLACAEAVELIAMGDGVYGAQAHEYKQIAKAALAQLTER